MQALRGQVRLPTNTAWVHMPEHLLTPARVSTNDQDASAEIRIL